MSEARLRWSLLAMRLSVFLVMAAWTLDKLVRPEHAGKVFAGFYGLGGLGAKAMYGVAARRRS